MSFGRRLALFFILIALVPTLALIGMLAIVTQDSREGKADARLAAGVITALAVYDSGREDAREAARELSGTPQLSALLAQPSDPARIGALERAAGPDVIALEMLDRSGRPVAEFGPDGAIAFATVSLTRGGEVQGTLRVSTTGSSEYASEVSRLTLDQAVVVVDGEPTEATVTPPSDLPESGVTSDFEIGGDAYRARMLTLSEGSGEELLLLGPGKEKLSFGGPAAAFLIACLLIGMALAYTLARTLSRLHMQVAEQAITDPLTGLWNRRRMMQLLDREVARAQRFGGEISMVIIDIDDFKEINDLRGHLHGDAVLESIADTVRETTRSIDVGARYGGDELALILFETGADGALILANRLRERVKGREVLLRDGTKMDVTISVGVATLPDSAEGAEDLIEAADQALLRAKRAGKDQTHVAPVRSGFKRGSGAKAAGGRAARGPTTAGAAKTRKKPATGARKQSGGAKKPGGAAKKPPTRARKPKSGD